MPDTLPLGVVVPHEGVKFASLSESGCLLERGFKFIRGRQRPDGIAVAPVGIENALGAEVGSILHHDFGVHGMLCLAEAGCLEQFGDYRGIAGAPADVLDRIGNQLIEPESRSQLRMAAAVDDDHAFGFEYPGEFREHPLMPGPVLFRIIRHMMQNLVDHNGVNALAVYR